MRQLFYHKMRHKFVIQNAFGFLLQNVSGFYYKMYFATVLLQNNAVFTNCNDCITKCDSYYKMRRLVQIATVQNVCLKFKLFSLLFQNLHFNRWPRFTEYTFLYKKNALQKSENIKMLRKSLASNA